MFKGFILGSCAFLLSATFAYGQALDLSSGVPFKIEDIGPDLPPIGSSVFDKLFYQPQLKAYKIPFPINRLVNRVGEMDLHDQEIAFTLIPFSRSLQRPTDLSYDPLLNPRMVFGVFRNENPQLRNKLFWAYVKPKDQLEVIAYNEEAGRFEFQVVKSYSKNPKVFYASRAKCMTCHQGQAPIFPLQNWNDTSGLAPSLTRNVLLEAAHFKGNKSDNFVTGDFLKDYFIGKSDDLVDNIFGLDGAVRDAEEISLFQRVWVHGCGEDNSCRLSILIGSLAPSQCQNISAEGIRCRSVGEAVDGSPLRNEKRGSSALQPTDIGLQQALMKLKGGALTFPSDDKAEQLFVNSPTAQLSIIENLKHLSWEFSPSISRMDAIFYGLGFHGDFQEVGNLFRTMQDSGQKEIYETLLKLYQSNSPLFDKKPLRSNELLLSLAKVSGRTNNIGFKFLPSVALDNPQVLTENIPMFFSSEPLNAMARHCASCHQTSNSYPPQFLTGTEEQVQEKILQLKDGILTRIRSRDMPPAFDLQQAFKNSPDRNIIIKYLTDAGAKSKNLKNYDPIH